ncbi:MAG TPA: hypothetical protein PKX82_04715, partial [Rhodoferax sp.]|nr:hypothetical protein [Rhodoferax sp.]
HDHDLRVLDPGVDLDGGVADAREGDDRRARTLGSVLRERLEELALAERQLGDQLGGGHCALPAAPVPPVQYRSALDDLPKGVEQATTDWKAANATNGQFKRGHADLLQWELDQARKRTSPAAGAQP